MIVSLVETFFHKRYKVNLHKDYLLIENVNFFFRLTRASSTTRWAARKISDLYSHQTKNERERRKERLRNKFLAVATCILMAGMMLAPIGPVNAKWAVQSWMNTIQYRYFASQDSLFTALLTPDSSGGIDIMDWPLTGAEYQMVIGNANVQVCPSPGSDALKLAFNNNWTDGIHMDRRSPMNYTDFRNALNCLVDRFGIIAGPALGGFATRDDTQIPQPLMSAYVYTAVSYPNYPWEFNVTHALQILYNDGWYNHAIYPTFGTLLVAYGGGSGSLSTAGGTTSGVVYSGNDTNGQWGGNDAQATANAGLANTPLQPLIGFVINNGARKDLGNMFCNELQAIGCPYFENFVTTDASLRPYVWNAQLYDFATLYYSGLTAPPEWFYTECTPVGIYPGGPNPYLIDDTNMTSWATKMYTDSPPQYQTDLNNVQDILVMESEFVSISSTASYNAYKTGMLGMIDELGYSFEGSLHSQLLNWIMLNCRKCNTINYTGPPASTPESNIIYYGELNPPDMINPIFSNSIFDSEIEDEIFTYPIAKNPYNPMTPGSAITGVSSGSDLPWMAYSWKTTLIPAQDGSGGQWTNVTLWFRNDITWQDGVPFTVDDVNYTIYENAIYGDSWAHASFMYLVDAATYAPYFTKWNDWACSILVKSSSWLSLYACNFAILPKHLYQYIVPSNYTAAEAGLSTDGLHGLWPGQSATAGNILPGAPFTLSQLQNEPEITLVGTGKFMYRIGSLTGFAAGDGITLDAYPRFFMSLPRGAIAFKYTWLNTAPNAQPSGGYYKVGLADLVYMANAYRTVGYPANVSINGVPGAPHTWNPACDLSCPSCIIG